MVPRLPPRQLGMMAGTFARILIDPADEECQIHYFDDSGENDRMRSADILSHSCHAIYLGSEVTPGRPLTLPTDDLLPWPAKTRPGKLALLPDVPLSPSVSSTLGAPAAAPAADEPALPSVS